MTDNADVPLTDIFDTDDADMLALATLALDKAGIEYMVHGAPTDPLFGGLPVSQGPSHILVRPEDASRASEVLAGLDQPASAMPLPQHTPVAAPIAPVATGDVIALHDAGTGVLVGRITDAQMHTLIELLEEADDDTPQYYIDTATIDMLSDAGVDPGLVSTLRQALGGRESMDIRWAEAAD